MSFPISVIIPTFNGANRISCLLYALELQDVKNFETIVVIDGSTDNTLEILNQKIWDLNLRIITQENKGRAGARNAGVSEAIGKSIVFYDDDVEPKHDSVSLHINALDLAHISVGQQLEPLITSTEFGKYKAAISRKWLANLGNEPVILNSQNLFLTAANMAIKTKTFTELQGFDAALKDAEDYDLAVRAITTGHSIIYTPKNHVIHHAFNSFKDYILRQREYRKAQQILINLRDPDNRNELYQKYHIKKSEGKKIVYFFVPGTLVKLIDKGLLQFLPIKFRHAIYGRIISALSVYYPQRKLW